MDARSSISARIEDHDLGNDIAAIQSNASVPTMLETVCLATGLRFAAIARVNEERWITCSTVDHLGFGLSPGDELVVESTLCHDVRQFATEIIINDVECDDVHRDHHTPKQYGFRSYLSVPIFRPDGSFFGTLCALDPEPNRLDDIRILKMVRLFAKLIGDSLQVEEKLQEVQGELATARHLSGMQERFIAILAHDLRNPISAILSGLRILTRTYDDPETVELIGLMNAAAQRMADLVNNLMDHARNRLGEGLVLNRIKDDNLREVLEQIVSECRTMAPNRQIDLSIDIPGPVYCDPARIAQLFSNLLGNAISHGAEDRPIQVAAHVTDGLLRLQVANEGPPIPKEKIPELFTAFSRVSNGPGQEGLGLGLYIASEIARAHGGRMEVTSDTSQTVFTFEMPCL